MPTIAAATQATSVPLTHCRMPLHQSRTVLDSVVSVAQRVGAAWFLGFVALALAGWAGDRLVATLQVGPMVRQGFQALVMSGLVVPGVWLLLRRMDSSSLESFGILGLHRSLKGFALGAGLIAAPTALTLFCIATFKWATLAINPVPGAVSAIAIGLVTAFLFEALPEELLFRGYIYRSLNSVMRQWTASVLTTVLFAMLPVVVVLAQQHLLHMQVRIGNSDHVTGKYLVTVLVFGAVLQFLRVLTGTVWTCIGFHLLFLMSNRIAGMRSSAFIVMQDVTSEGPMQLVLIGSALLLVTSLVLYPRLSGQSLGWSSVRALTPAS